MTDIVLADRPEVAKWHADSSLALAEAASVARVESQDELERAGSIEARLKSLIKELNAQRLALTGPIEALKKKIIADEKTLVKPLETALDSLHAMTTAYATRLEQERQAALKRAAEVEAAQAEAAVAQEEAAAVFGLVDNTPAPVAPAVFVPDRVRASAQNRIVEKWDFEVTDPSAVPRELCSVDATKIRAFLRGKKSDGYKAEQIQVPGLRIFLTMQVQSR